MTRRKSDLQRWGARVGALLAGGAIAGAIAMLAFAPRSGALTTTAAIFVSNNGCDSVTAYPTGASGNVAPISPGTALCWPTGVAVDSKGNIYVANFINSTVTVYPAGSNGNIAPSSTIGGSNTGLNRPTAIALDASGNIYVTNDGSSFRGTDTVTVYPAGSNGNVAPSSTIGGSNTGLSLPQGVALDSSGKIYVTNDGSDYGGTDTVTVYSAGSNGNLAPSSTIGGSNTGLDQPLGVALDASSNIYVVGGGGVTVYPAGSNGNVAPSSIIDGSNTGLDPEGIAVGASGKIYVTNDAGGEGGNGTVTVYPAGSNGNLAPSSTIGGSNTGLNAPAGIALDASGNIYVANGFGLGGQNGPYRATVYPAGSNGNVAPSSTIGDSNTYLYTPSGIALDASGNIYVANAFDNAVTVYPAGSNANVAPTSTIGGPKTGLDTPVGIALDAGGNIYVANDGSAIGGNDTVTVYPAGSNGNVAPSSAIAGFNTGLNGPLGIALDASGNIYVTNDGGNTVTAYPAGSNGNAAPRSTIAGSNTGLNFPVGIALDAGGTIYVANDGSNAVTIYRAGSNGNIAPSSAIAGSNTGLEYPYGIALDANGNICVVNSFYAGVGVASSGDAVTNDTVTVYAAGSNGNVAPSATIAGPATELGVPEGIAIGPEQAPGQTATPTSSATPTPTPTPTPRSAPTPTPTPIPRPTPTPTPTPTPVAAKLTASPTSLTFATRAEGTTSKPQVVTLTNAKTKKQNLTITVLGVAAAGDFAVPAGACVGPLGAGQKCKISVTFTPTGTGTRKGSLNVTSNASNRSLTVSLKGTGKK